MVSAGMTHQQIADSVAAQRGRPVSRSAVSAALHRAGASRTNPSYRDVIPWTVHSPHQRAYQMRMLRLLGRRRQQLTMSGEDAARLSSWFGQLERLKLTVAYAPHTAYGLLYVSWPTDTCPWVDGIPVHIRALTSDQVGPGACHHQGQVAWHTTRELPT